MMKRSWPAIAIFLALLLCAVGLSLITPQTAAAQMPPTPTSDRLAPWPTVYPPTQADQGAQEYYQRCMVCHGDRGQGLTDEWRGALDVQDANCWQSGCHNPRHPPGGFIFPKVVPAVVGTGTLDNFSTGLDLYHFIKLYMPYQAPGSLSDEMYWQLTAYLLRANGVYSGQTPLDEETAASIRLAPAQAAVIQDTASPWSGWWPYLLAGVVLLLAIVLGAVRSLRKQ